MGKIQETEIHCGLLKAAYDRANRSAFSNLGDTPIGARWDSDTYGNHVTGKGTAIGKDTCTGCGKHISVTLNFPKIAATNWETGKPIKLFDSLGGTESIAVSGHKCSENNHQK
jgi:hypothetical protein